MKNELEEKQGFIARASEMLAMQKERCAELKAMAVSGGKADSPDIAAKLVLLEKCLVRFEWRLRHFQEEEDTSLGEEVEGSFCDVIDEINWRYREIALNLHEKELADGDEIQRMGETCAIREKFSSAPGAKAR